MIVDDILTIIFKLVAPSDKIGCCGGRPQPRCGLEPRFKADTPRLLIAPQDWHKNRLPILPTQHTDFVRLR